MQFDSLEIQFIELNEVHNIHCKAISSLAFIAKRNIIISGSSDLTIRLGKVSLKQRESNSQDFFYKKNKFIVNYQPQIILVGHIDTISTLNYSEENDWVISGGNEGVIFIWDAITGKKKFSYKAHTQWITSLRFFRLGISNKIVSGGADGMVCLYDFDTGSFHKINLNSENENFEWISFVDFLDIDRYILVCLKKKILILNAYNLNEFIYKKNNDGMAIHGAFQMKRNGQSGLVLVHSNGLTFSILN
jgi:WD40 repeat protein